LIYQPSSRVSYKLLFGRAFRNPSAYELFSDDAGFSTAANPALRPEKANTFEFDINRKLGRRLNASVSAYHYSMNDLIVGMYTPAGLFQFQNAERVSATGAEVEINGHPLRWLELATGLSQQRAVNLAHNFPLANSPGPVAKLRFAVPLFSSRFSLAGATQYRGTRQTPDGATLPSVWLSDVTISSNRLPSNLEFQAGVRNIANRKSLAGPKSSGASGARPDPAKIKTTNYTVYGGTDLSIAQWIISGAQLDSHASGQVYDWFQARSRDIFNSATGDTATVLHAISSYTIAALSSGGQTTLQRTAQTSVIFNPYFVQSRLNSLSDSPCGNPRTKYFTNSHLHEGRHAYQGSQAAISGNDADLDWMVKTVSISPTNILVDSTAARTVCNVEGGYTTETRSYHGDTVFDTFSSPDYVGHATEQDAEVFATNHDH